MADVYCDGQLTTGANDGSSWADAYRGAAGLQAALDAAAAGDVIHVTRTFTLPDAIDVDIASGLDGSPIRVVGYNYNGGAPVNDGTKAVLDADATAANCIVANDTDHWFWENVEFANATATGCEATGSRPMYWVFHRCDSHGHGGAGWGGADHWQASVWHFCRAFDNGGDGWETSRISYSSLYACSSMGNTGRGFGVTNYTQIVACIASGNGSDGFFLSIASLLHCVADGNGGDGLHVGLGPVRVAFCRLTNSSAYGIDASGNTTLAMHCFLASNGSGDTNGSAIFVEDQGVSTLLTSGEVGYEDRSADRFNLRLGAAGYARDADLGGGNRLRAPMGLPTMIVPRLGGSE